MHGACNIKTEVLTTKITVLRVHQNKQKIQDIRLI